MTVRWTARAELRLDAIHAFIASKDPAAATRLVHALLRRSMQLAAFPQSGRRVPDYAHADVRELIEGQYRIVYRLHGQEADVIAVMHCAQLLPGDINEI